MRWIDPLAIGFVILWLAATIGYQFTPVRAAIGRLDVLRLLPRWSFFAPFPTMRDSHLVVRDLCDDGKICAWQPAAAFPVRRPIDAIWNPAKRPQKVLSDACQGI